ncbi:unnamed protein product, partial [Ixodes hexagonus]
TLITSCSGFRKIRRTFMFWNDKGVPYQTFSQYLRFVYDLYTKPLHEVVRKNYESYGRVYGSYQGFVPTLVVGDPDLLSGILVRDFESFRDRTVAQKIGSDVWKKSVRNLSGEEWRRARNILSSAFTPVKLKTVCMQHALSVARVILQGPIEKPFLFCVLVCKSRVFENCSMDSTAMLVYSMFLISFEDYGHPFLLCYEELFRNVEGWQLVMLLTMPSVYRLLLSGYPPKEKADALKKFVSVVVQERQMEQANEDDILQMFLDADHGGGDGDESSADRKKAMTLDEITAQALLFFLAGTHTVMSAMTYTAYCLALNPQCQEKALTEVDTVLEKRGFGYDTLQDMPYLEACIKEALRMYTPDSLTTRLCTKETTVGGVSIKPGMNVDVPIAGIHYDPEFFPDPEEFRPERFLPGNEGSLRPLTYLAFGAGPRNCVGMHLGILQVKMALARILERMKFKICKETMIPLKFKPRSLLPQMDGPLMLRVILREDDE